MKQSTSFAQVATNQFDYLSSALCANTPPCKKHSSSRKFLTLSISLRLLLVMLLTLTVTINAWGASTVQGGYIYFDELNSGYTGAGDMQFWVGHDSYSSSYSMSQITNTKLWYCEAPSWNDATYFAFTSGANWGAKNQKYYDRIGNNTWKSATKEGYTLNSDQYYVFKVASTANKAAVNSDSPYGHQGAAYTALNKTITIKAKVSTNGGTSYSEANTPAKLTGSSKIFTANSSCAGTSGASATLNAGSSSTTFKAGYTANTTLTAVAATGYTFAGWYSGSTKISDNLSITVNPTGDVTYYAYYKANSYTVKFNANGGTGSMSNQSHTYDVSKALTANTFTRTGYSFAGWATSKDGDAVYADKQSVSNLTNVNNGTVTLYAKWTLNTYPVKWFVNGEELTGAATTVAHGSKITTIPEVDLNTYCEGSDVLAGWIAAPMENASVAAPANLYKTIEDFPTVEGPQTYYAVFANYKE